MDATDVLGFFTLAAILFAGSWMIGGFLCWIAELLMTKARRSRRRYEKPPTWPADWDL